MIGAGDSVESATPEYSPNTMGYTVGVSMFLDIGGDYKFKMEEGNG